MGRKKNLTVSNLKKDVKKFDEQITVNVGDYTLKVDKYFRKTKKMNFTSEMMVQVQYAKEHDIDLNAIMIPFSILMLIKHFSSVEIPNNLNEQIAVLNMLIDNNLLSPIFEAFEQSEVTSLFQEFEESVVKTQDIFEEMSELFEQAEIGKPLEYEIDNEL